MDQADAPDAPPFTCMSNNASATETAPTKFYSPAASASAAAGRIERFITALYESHRRHTQQLE